ncbi:serine hydrolase [Antrihabitans sp. YC2-6]|uniref:serine hydrolase domain-containing protein n=1 Tax=Antrihabitans sp. YC2-6 TaxID=2799498 RepID=UPI0018F74304|nr:serine hydrolase domain-containing protein [Antrihabitans sp. YC2-6]MBJ8345583.1 beta-lactamase family protein [Antrihabitans sp. YC2-6]
MKLHARRRAGARHRARRMTLFALVAVTALVSSGAVGQYGMPSANATTAELAATVDAIVQARMSAELIPGVVVSVVDPELGEYTHAYGIADAATNRPMTVDDRFRIGSVTKSFTATAVLQLADAGKLNLDDTLAMYVDGIPNGTEIRIRDLLGMRGGVYDYSTDPEFAEQYFVPSAQPDWTAADTLRVIAANPEKAVAPNTVTAYSNSEYYLLGLVLETVTGKPVGEVLESGVIDDLGLTETAFPADADLPDPASRGYQYESGKRTDVTERTPADTFSTAGAIVSTVSDMAKFAEQLADGELLKPETQLARTQFTDETTRGLEYGLGLIRIGDWVGHAGDVAGYSDFVFYLPERRATVVVAVNLTDAGLSADASSIWLPIVSALYPESVPGNGTPAPSTRRGPIPTATELDGQLREALDPDLDPSEKVLKVDGDEHDPELISTLADLFVAADQALRVTRVTDFDHGDIAATIAVQIADGTTLPELLPLVYVDGVLKIGRGWACRIVVGSGLTSPAC